MGNLIMSIKKIRARTDILEIQKAIDSGRDLNEPLGSSGMTLLDRALLVERMDIAELLVDAGAEADVNELLQRAACFRKMDIVKILLDGVDAGAEVDVNVRFGRSEMTLLD